MPNKHRKPAWWQMFALVPLMLSMMLAATQLALPQWAEEVVEIGIVVATFWGMLFWVHINAGLLEQEALEKDDSFDDLNITIFDPESKSERESTELKAYGITDPPARVRPGWIIERKESEKWQLN